jgi:hypothetical protein
MNDDRVVRIWSQVATQSGAEPMTVAHVCAAVVAGTNVDGGGVTLMVGPTVRDTLHVTDQVAGELEEWQLSFGQGPCVDAFLSGGPVLASNLESPEDSARWPAFTSAALASGARAVFALPLQIGTIRMGVLDLYRTKPGPLSSHDLADALAFADTAAMLLLDDAVGASPETADLAWQHDDPTAHHAEVHQATGMMLVQLQASAESAFARLRAYAYAHDRRIGDVARDVVARRLRFGPDPPAGYHDEQ